MFEYASFAVRNPSHVTKHWRTQYKTRKALLEYRKANPVCEITGLTKSLQVHHLIPVSIRPDLAADPSNLMTLTKNAHLIVGHLGNWKNFNPHARTLGALLSDSVVVTSEFVSNNENDVTDNEAA